MGLLDDFAALPFFLKYLVILIAASVTAIKIPGTPFSIADFTLTPLFNIIFGGFEYMTGFEIGLSWEQFVILLWIGGVLMIFLKLQN